MDFLVTLQLIHVKSVLKDVMNAQAQASVKHVNRAFMKKFLTVLKREHVLNVSHPATIVKVLHLTAKIVSQDTT